MITAPSAGFRRSCLALALLAVTWSLPGNLRAEAYPLQEVKTIVDLLKPNVLIVLETAQSMQGLAGESAARYNEVGADCEDGSRSCRLVGQDGRWSFSGMGKNGMYFGLAPASCTTTETYTDVGTTVITTSSSTATTTQTTVSITSSNSSTLTATGSGTASQQVTGTGQTTGSASQTATGSATNNITATVSGTASALATSTWVATYTSTAAGAATVFNNATQTKTASRTTTATSMAAVTLSATVTVSRTATLTGTVSTTATATLTPSATGTGTGSGTGTAAVTVSGSVTQTASVTSSGSATATGTITGTITTSVTNVGIVTASGTGTATGVVTKEQVATGTMTLNGSVARTGTGTATSSIDGTSLTVTKTATGTGTGTATASATATVNGTSTPSSLLGTGTANQTRYVTTTPSGTGTVTATFSGTGSGGSVWTYYGTTINQTQSTDTGTYMTMVRDFSAAIVTARKTGTQTATASNGSVVTVTVTSSATASNGTPRNGLTGTATFTSTANYTRNATFTGTWTSTASLTFNATYSGTQTATGTYASRTTTTTSTTTQTTTITSTYQKTGTASGTVTGTTNVTVTGNVTGTPTVTASGTATGTGSKTATASVTATGSITGNGTATASMTAATVTASTNVTGTVNVTGTGTYTTVTDTLTAITLTSSGTATDTYTQTLTRTISTCGFEGSQDPGRCDAPPSTPTSSGYCYLSNGAACSSNSACSAIKGDFCQFISTLDGSGRRRVEECITTPGSPWGSCKHGVATANTSCSSYTDASCGTALAGDFCAEGKPAKMCADTGLWCRDDGDCLLGSLTDLCVPATSRMMTVKRALRRAIADYSDKVNFGFMNTYQGAGIPATATDASTAIFPYVKLTSCPSNNNVTETRLVTRGELEKGTDGSGNPCFTLATGPSDTCTIDYGGNGAVNSTASLNQITYSKTGTNDSRWLVPRADGSGKYNRITASWSTCSSSTILPACQFVSQGTGLYEGSYYSFSYKQGTPIASGLGSMATPVYFTTYKGKFYSDGTNCYNAIDAERTDIVNDGVYGRPAYTLVSPATTPYTVTGTGTSTSVAIATSKEASVAVPWSGSEDTGVCGAKTGAIWNSNVVPFLTDTTFGGKVVTRAQKALMMNARLDKASFGGVGAVGKDAPLGCALQNENAADQYHSAAAYIAAARTNDAAANGNKAPCWSNNIVLVVDGLSDGPGERDVTADCASTACAYSSSNTALTGCNCAAITKALSLAQAGVQTHVVANAPNSADDTLAWHQRYPYAHAFLWNLAVAGSLGFGTPSFGVTEEEVYKGISDKIAAAAYPFTYTTTVPVAGATTQDPTTTILTMSTMLFDTSVSYPSWKGTVRAFDTSAGVELKWDAATVAASGYPSSWKARRIFFSDKTGAVVRISIDGTSGAVGNATDLFNAGLGASSVEAEKIVQWLLGKPGTGNPAPLMGPPTASTPIVVGQGASNGLAGSVAFSANTWKRPPLVYVGADDGMLHAFFAHVGPKTLNGVTYQGGEEAFAFIPNDMLSTITKLYAQGRQNLAVDKTQHIFGLSGSPKVKDVCMGAGCESSDGSNWHTILVMPQGPGGNNPFALDITNVIHEVDGLLTRTTSPDTATPLALLWSTAPKTSSANTPVKLSSSSDGDTYEYSLGETTSLPGFYFAGYSSGAADNRMILASGYPTKPRTTSGYSNQGLTIVNADATSGTIKSTHSVGAISVTDCSPRVRALLGDVAVARNYASETTSQLLLGAYAVDTWGNAYQYVPTATPAVTKLYSRGCGQPIFHAPAVVQLDRVPRADTSSKGYIYLAQVTNSSHDPATAPYHATNFPGSEIVVTKLAGGTLGVPPAIVTSYNSQSGTGQVILSTDPSTSSTNRICLQSTNVDAFTENVKTGVQSCTDAGGIVLPETARPVGTPTAIVRADGLGFQIITSWYDASVISNDCSGGNQFNYGKSYITVHEFGADGTWYQIAGITLTNTVLTGVSFVGTGLYVDGINTNSAPQSLSVGESFTKMQQILNNSALERYTRTTWSERVE